MINDKQLEESTEKTPWFSKRINDAYAHFGFISIFVGGFQGMGKTRYGMKIMYGVYKDWDKVLENIYFDPEKLKTKLREATKDGTRFPCVMLDDAGVGLIKYEAQRKPSIEFNKLFSLIRTTTAGFVFTAVEKEDIQRYVRGKFRYGIAITGDMRKMKRMATGYEYKLALWNPLARPKGTRIYGAAFSLDDIPQDILNRYEQMRREYILEVTAEPIPESEHARPSLDELATTYASS